jgi:hypothetical protein
MYYAATTTDPKISRPIYKADGTENGQKKKDEQLSTIKHYKEN